MQEKLNDEKLQKFEELVDRLEKAHRDEPHPKEPRPPHHPLPHEEDKLKIDFKDDEELLKGIFGDEDTAKAVVRIMAKSPAEIQIVFKIVIDLYNKVEEK